ncbi:WG repeat-containing protein [Riemerella anatipestifer]|nr:WG repeat-containing protein [Riemerella anatipestifer]MDY3532294.1 WG repeat-containing protein [Riemerella anatipestifer]MDY3535151.1 WG repeat-containing protein [Riemerella anatipestifer]
MKLDVELYQNDYLSDFLIFSTCRKKGILFKDFTKIIPPIYDDIKIAFSSFVWVKRNESWFLMNIQNQEVIEKAFAKVNKFNLNYCCVSENGVDFGFIDIKGEWIIPPNYTTGQFLGLHFFGVKNKSGKFGIIDLKENIIHPFTLDTLPTFSNVVSYLLKRRKTLKEWLQL